jgi:F-type H+-transporting ATPase subunit delta
MTQAEQNYGHALYSLAVEESASKQILEELDAVQAIFSGVPEYLRLLSTPSIPKQERCQILDDCLRGKVHPYVLNFLKILTEDGRIRSLHGCCEAYRRQYNEDNGILTVTAVTAVPLSDELKQRLTQKLTQITGKTILLSCREDPACMGGVQLDMDGKRLDGTLRHRLDEIQQILKNTVL